MRRISLLAIYLTAAAGLARADTLLLDGIELDARTADSRPARGMTMERVESTYGEPSQRHAAVGDPPISRWDYPDFTVYFEYQRVIHAIASR